MALGDCQVSRLYIYIYIYIYIYTHTNTHECGLKSSYESIISAVDDFFYKWDPSTVTLMEDVDWKEDYVEKLTTFS